MTGMRVAPLYQQLVDNVCAEVAEGRLKPGDRLPTEVEFSRLSGVSRITVRQALDILRQRGLVERFPGRGSFVSMRAHTAWKIESVDDLIHLAGDIRTTYLEWALAPPPDEVATFLGAQRAWRMRGVRSRGGILVHYIEVWVPVDLGDRLTRDDFAHGTVIALIEKKLGLTVRHALEQVSAGTADARLARRLRVRRGAPVLVQDIKFVGPGRRPLEWLRVWWRADRFRRHNELSRFD